MSAPVNDWYVNAIDISAEENGSISGTFAESTTQNYPGSKVDVWYKYTAQVPGRLKLTMTSPTPFAADWIEMWRGAGSGDNYSTCLYIDDRGSDYPDDYSVVVEYDVSPGVINHIGLFCPSSKPNATFTLDWFLQIPLADPVTGQKNEAISTGYATLAYITHNPLINEVWSILDTSDSLYSSGVRQQVIARTRDGDSVLVGYINSSLTDTPHGLTQPFFYDAKNMLVWAAVADSADSATSKLFKYDATTAAKVGEITLSSPAGVWDGIDPATGNFLHWEGNTLKTSSISGTLLSTVAMDNGLGALWQQRYVGDGTIWAFTAQNYPYPSELAQFNQTTGAKMGSYDIDNLQGHQYDEAGHAESPDKRYMQRFVYDPDRNSLWILREGGLATEPRTTLLEFSLGSKTVVATYPVQDFQHHMNIYDLMVYDPYRQSVALVSYDNHMLTQYSTATGAVVTRQEASYAEDIPYAVTPTPYAVYVGGIDNYFYRVGMPMPELDIPVINDRDVWLQSFAYVDRFEKVTAQRATDVSGSQVIGTGIVITGAKKLDLSASSQTFRVGTALVEPSWITLSPTLRNLSGPPAYTVISGSATLGTIGDKCVIEYAGMSSDRVTVRASVTDSGVTYTDQVTLVKIVDGGTALVHLLTNETHAVFADSVGNVVSYIGASGEFRVWEGAVEVTSKCTFELVSDSANTLSSISNLGRYVVDGLPASTDQATIVFRATYKGTSFDETFSLTKIKAPAGSGGDPTKQTVGGKRLPMNFTVPIPGTTWSNVAANQAVIPYDGTVLNDIVTEYNNSAVPPYRETRFWNFTKWETLDAKIDGSLLVTGSVSADALSANTVDAITGNFETLVADQITAARAEIDQIIADQIDAVNGNFDTLTVGGTQILPNSINTGHVVDNAINVPIILESDPNVIIGSPYNSGGLSAAYTGPATGVVTVTARVGASAGANPVVNVEILLDGGSQGTKAVTVAAGQVGSFVVQTHVAVSAGSHSWAVVFSAASGSYALVDFTMTVMGVMK